MLVPWRVPQHKWPSNFSLKSFKRGAKKGIPGYRQLTAKAEKWDVVGQYRPSLFGGSDCNFSGASCLCFKLQGWNYSFQGLGGKDHLI